MRKLRWSAFRKRPGGSCGHQHKTKSAAEKCATTQARLRTGKWYVGSAYYSH